MTIELYRTPSRIVCHAPKGIDPKNLTVSGLDAYSSGFPYFIICLLPILSFLALGQ